MKEKKLLKLEYDYFVTITEYIAKTGITLEPLRLMLSGLMYTKFCEKLNAFDKTRKKKVSIYLNIPESFLLTEILAKSDILESPELIPIMVYWQEVIKNK